MQIFEKVAGLNTVLLEIQFPQNFPNSPPFIRVVYPRFYQYTGHITIGGSLCLEELTSSGWRPDFDFYSFIIMLRNLLIDGGALIDLSGEDYSYSKEEAYEAFVRVANAHGWKP